MRRRSEVAVREDVSIKNIRILKDEYFAGSSQFFFEIIISHRFMESWSMHGPGYVGVSFWNRFGPARFQRERQKVLVGYGMCSSNIGHPLVPGK